MSKFLEYRATRAFQICIVYATTLLIERLLQFNRAGWIGFVVMMIYVGFDAGASMNRTFHRFLGTMIGLLLSYFLWLLGLLDYRLIMTVIPIIVFFSFFSLGKFYSYPTIFTVTLTSLGTAYFSPENYDAYYFFFDYFKATIVAFFICIFFEGIVFKDINMSQVFHDEHHAKVLDNLEQLFVIATNKKIHKTSFLKASAECHAKILDTLAFEVTSRSDYALIKNELFDTEYFHQQVTNALDSIRQLFLLAPHRDESLVLGIRTILDQLWVFHTRRET